MKIVSAYRGMSAFLDAVWAAPADDRQLLWQEHAVAPFWNEWAAGQPFEDRVRRQFSNPYDDLETLKVRVDLLAASGIEQTALGALGCISALLPKVEDTRVCIYALDPVNRVVSQRQHGVLGSCIGDNLLLLIDPTVPDWQDWVPQVLAHEWHHSVWGYQYYFVKGNRRADLLTSMVCDGQAEAFGYLVAYGVQPLWPSFDTQTERELWASVQEHLRSDDRQVYMRYMFGDEAAGIPWCFGYQVGYHIIRAHAARHPDRTVMDLLNEDSWEILRQSGYQP